MLVYQSSVGKVGEANFTVEMKAGKAVLQEAFAKIPLKLSRPLYPENPGSMLLYIMNPTGGMLGGDNYYINGTVKEGAMLCLATQSAAKIYRSNGKPVKQKIIFHVDNGGFLEYFPHPTIPFANSNFESNLELYLRKESSVLLADILAPGREKFGEKFSFEKYFSQTEVYLDDKIILLDRLVLNQATDFSGMCMFGNWTHLGNLYIFSPKAGYDLLKTIKAVVKHRKNITAGVSLTNKHGIVIRALGGKAEDIAEMFNAVRKCI